jgi:hypothetical protein
MGMLAHYNPAVEKAMYETVQNMPAAAAMVLLVVIGLSLIWVFKKR